MGSWTKFLIGLAAVLLLGWLGHGPGGRGEAFVARLEAGAQTEIAKTALPGITVAMQRDPLSRTAVLTGPANRLQREGLGSLPGIDGRVGSVPGMAGVRWTNPPTS